MVALGYLNVEATEENVKKYDELFKCCRCKPSCCEGKLFDNALIFPEEVERLAKLANISKRAFEDKHTTVKNGQRFLKLPCPFYKDGCSIYPNRLKVCREFPLNKTYIQNGKIWMTVGMDCPAGKELAEKYAVMVVT